MYIGYLQDRQQLGYKCTKDLKSIEQLNELGNAIQNNVACIITQGGKTIILVSSKHTLVAILIFLKSRDLQPHVEPTLVGSVEISQSNHNSIKSAQFSYLESTSAIQGCILSLTGGSDPSLDHKQEKLMNSVLSKARNSSYTQISINKVLKKVVEKIYPIISDQRLLRILVELERPYHGPTIVINNRQNSVIIPGFENVKNDFETRLNKQKQLGNRPFLGLPLPSYGRAAFLPSSKSDLPRNKTSAAKHIDKIKSRSSTNRLKMKSPLFANANDNDAHAHLQPTVSPTFSLFGVDRETQKVEDIRVAYTQFRQEMTQIARTYPYEKKEDFLRKLNDCSMKRFESLATENNQITFTSVREAITMLQSEFEGYHEMNSITRMTKEELQAGNKLDGRFRKGVLSGDFNTLNENYTDLDVKHLVSDNTLQYQANVRKKFGYKNPNKMSLYEQTKKVGISIVLQKHKHCDPLRTEFPSSPVNVKHVINAIELLPNETTIVKNGILDGARAQWALTLGVPESSISDEMALQGIMFINENVTIERVNEEL